MLKFAHLSCYSYCISRYNPPSGIFYPTALPVNSLPPPSHPSTPDHHTSSLLWWHYYKDMHYFNKTNSVQTTKKTTKKNKQTHHNQYMLLQYFCKYCSSLLSCTLHLQSKFFSFFKHYTVPQVEAFPEQTVPQKLCSFAALQLHQ